MTLLRLGWSSVTLLRSGRWVDVCALSRLQPEPGVAALFGDVQVAVIRTHSGHVYTLGNVDPFSGAAVMSRGIVGDRGGGSTVALQAGVLTPFRAVSRQPDRERAHVPGPDR